MESEDAQSRLEFEAQPKFRSAMNTPYQKREKAKLKTFVAVQREVVEQQLFLRNEATIAAVSTISRVEQVETEEIAAETQP